MKSLLEDPEVPIGTIVYVEFQRAKMLDGWLPCDGAEYTKAEFPDLAQVLMSFGHRWGAFDAPRFSVPRMRSSDHRGRWMVKAQAEPDSPLPEPVGSEAEQWAKIIDADFFIRGVDVFDLAYALVDQGFTVEEYRRRRDQCAGASVLEIDLGRWQREGRRRSAIVIRWAE